MTDSMHQYYVYMLTNWNNKVLYIGVTSDLVKRVNQHKSKALAGFTSKYNVNKLVYYELHRDVNYAIRREKELKGWSRAKKNNLIASINPDWLDLLLK